MEEETTSRRPKRITLILLAAVVLTVISIGVDFLWLGRAASSSGGSDTTIESIPTAFDLDGTTWQLPFPVQNLLDDGWSAEDDLSDRLDSAETAYAVNFSKNGSQISVVLANTAADRALLSECQVIGLSGENLRAGGPVLSLPNGLTCGESQYRDVVGLLGEPSHAYRYDSTRNLSYNDENWNTLHLTLEDDVLTEVSFQVEPELNARAPEDLSAQASAWVGPPALGDSLNDLTLMVDGKLYLLGGPLNEFLKDGWMLQTADSTYSGDTRDYVERGGLYPGQSVYLLLIKDAEQMSVSLENDGREMVNFASCAVTYLDLRGGSGMTFTLPGGIAESSDSAKVKDALRTMGLDYDCNSCSYFDSYSLDLEPTFSPNSSGYGGITVNKDGGNSATLSIYGDIPWMKG